MKLFLLLLLAGQITAGDEPPVFVREYLQRCAAAQSEAIAAHEREIKRLAESDNRSNEQELRLARLKDELSRMRTEPPPLASMPLPPEKGAVGILPGAVVSGGVERKGVDVLEVVDQKIAIVRIWYPARDPPAREEADAAELTFADVWLHGIETEGWQPQMAMTLPQVFHVSGNKLIDTTCGKRSFALLQPVDVEPFRKGR